MKIAKKRGSAL